MSAILLDASAILAALLDEPGAERVRREIARGAVSAVNAAEVVSKLIDNGYSEAAAEAIFLGLMVEALDFSGEAGRLAGRLRDRTRLLGLSLGDRACLAEAVLARLPVLTADRAWAELDLGVQIEVIR